MSTNYPTSQDTTGTTLPNPTQSDDLDSPTVTHHTQHANANDAIRALQEKLGYTPGSPDGSQTAVANTVMVGVGTKFSEWLQITNAFISSTAAIAVSKLAAGSNKTVLTSNGTTNSFSGSPTLSGSLTAEGGLNVGSATAAATGEVKSSSHIKAGGSIFPSNQATLFGSAPIVASAVGATGTATVGTASRMGVVVVIDSTAKRTAIFGVNGSDNSTEIHGGDGTKFGVSLANDNKIHCIYSGGNYLLYNGYGVSHTLYAWFFGI